MKKPIREWSDEEIDQRLEELRKDIPVSERFEINRRRQQKFIRMAYNMKDHFQDSLGLQFTWTLCLMY